MTHEDTERMRALCEAFGACPVVGCDGVLVPRIRTRPDRAGPLVAESDASSDSCWEANLCSRCGRSWLPKPAIGAPDLRAVFKALIAALDEVEHLRRRETYLELARKDAETQRDAAARLGDIEDDTAAASDA